MSVEETLIQYLQTKLLFHVENPQVKPEDPLFNGLIDSTDMMKLVVFIEQQFGVRVADEDLLPENFQTVRTIAEYIRRKSPASA